jgi:hypothetical protein
MRLLPGYVTAPATGRAVAVRRPATAVAVADVLDAVAFEVLPPVPLHAQSPANLLHARTALELYSQVYEINAPPRGRLSVYV